MENLKLGEEMPAFSGKVPRYLVILKTPKGTGEMEVPSLISPEAATRRAIMTAAAIGWGDLPELYVISTTLIAEC